MAYYNGKKIINKIIMHVDDIDGVEVDNKTIYIEGMNTSNDYSNVVVDGDIPNIYINANDATVDFSNATGEITIIDKESKAHYYTGYPCGVDALLEGTLTEVTTYATTIRGYAFYQSKQLVTVNMPNIKRINSSAFLECSALETVNAPILEEVWTNAFNNCKALKQIGSPTLKQISSNAFNTCTALTDIYSGYDGLITLQNKSAFDNTNHVNIHVKPAYVEAYKTAANWCYLYDEGKVTFIGDYE